MCGIAGIFNRNGSKVASQGIRKMLSVLSHRGPDDEGTYFSNGIGLGHRRLSIIDLDSGHQPLGNETGSVQIVFNGEIYNYQELTAALKDRGHVFSTKSDTETIVHLYEEYGIESFSRLKGIFAFALWDENAERLILVRDQVGVKPLFYFIGKERVIFASEVKSILQNTQISREIDARSFDDYFALGYITGGKTIIKGIHSLLPANFLIIDKSREILKEYWDIPFTTDRPFKEKYYQEQLLGLLSRIIPKQMISDVAVGAFLSGGIDSSAVVSFMGNNRKEIIKTFSIGFKEKTYDESVYARMVSTTFRTQHKQKTINANIRNIIEKIIWFNDESFADTSTIPMYCLSQLASEEVKVVLSGDGGDENLLGYHTSIADKLHQNYSRFPVWLRKGLKTIGEGVSSGFVKVGVGEKIKRFLRGGVYPQPYAHYLWRIYFDDQERKKLFSPDFLRNNQGYSPFDQFIDLFDKHKEATLTQRLSYIDYKTWLVDDILRKVDRASMAHSLEARVPLLDQELIAFSARLPDNLKMKGIQGKYILKRALASRLPPKIINRPKQGFNAPIAYWINNELQDYVDDYLSRESITKSGYFNFNYVNTLLQDHRKAKKDNGIKIWSILVFMLWRDAYLT